MNLTSQGPTFSKPGTVIGSTRDGSRLANHTQKGGNTDINKDAFKLSANMTLFESAPYEYTFQNETTRETNKPSNRERGNQRASSNLDMYRTDISAIQKINDYIDNQPIRTSSSSMQEIF